MVDQLYTLLTEWQLLCHMSPFSPIKLDIPNDLKRVEDTNIFLIIYRPNFFSQVIRKEISYYSVHVTINVLFYI